MQKQQNEYLLLVTRLKTAEQKKPIKDKKPYQVLTTLADSVLASWSKTKCSMVYLLLLPPTARTPR